MTICRLQCIKIKPPDFHITHSVQPVGLFMWNRSRRNQVFYPLTLKLAYQITIRSLRHMNNTVNSAFKVINQPVQRLKKKNDQVASRRKKLAITCPNRTVGLTFRSVRITKQKKSCLVSTSFFVWLLVGYLQQNQQAVHCNYLLGPRGFALGSTVQSLTKGIWIWARIHPRDANKYLILLDTEGLGDVKKVRLMNGVFSSVNSYGQKQLISYFQLWLCIK